MSWPVSRMKAIPKDSSAAHAFPLEALPTAPPPFTLADIRRAIPAHCFKRDTIKSFGEALRSCSSARKILARSSCTLRCAGHLLRDLIVCSVLAWLALHIDGGVNMRFPVPKRVPKTLAITSALADLCDRALSLCILRLCLNCHAPVCVGLTAYCGAHSHANYSRPHPHLLLLLLAPPLSVLL